MKVSTIWNKLTQLVGVLVALAACVLAGLLFWRPIRENQALRREVMILDESIRSEQRLNEAELDLIRRLEHDTNTVERFAREILHLARTNETIIYFAPPPDARRRPPVFGPRP